MNPTNVVAVVSSIALATALLAGSLSVMDWQFWVAGLSLLLAFLAGQMHGRAHKNEDRKAPI
ncbi:hypothetical protein [Burkholderia ubonensis]|uniref:hypothetical protein n=1 Tax=Burkholderia ubonensis TaxID=101571 RepID=UPI000753061D|nr:hypothetical protein [Burkholderia ubonensis]KVV07326.1 hypothetical protein WK77_16175 [Burkholderia ubonensis]